MGEEVGCFVMTFAFFSYFLGRATHFQVFNIADKQLFTEVRPSKTQGAPFVISGGPFFISGSPFTTKGQPFSISGPPFFISGRPFEPKGGPGAKKGGTREILSFTPKISLLTFKIF